MEFQFGTNWASYSRFVGDVFGSALAAEGIFAFFLESGFLAVLVFGWNRVGPKLHFISTVMVSLGSIFSSVWIVVANSWQQTPAGSHLVPMTRQILDSNGTILRDGMGRALIEPWVIDGVPVVRAEIVDFWQLLFNPSSLHRLTHVLLGCFIMGAFFVLSISSWYLLKKKHKVFAKRSFFGGLVLATISSVAIAISGHQQAQNVYLHQPAKLAAFEGHFKSDGPADLTLFGLPDSESNKTHYRLALPGVLSFLVHDDFTFSKPVLGLDRVRKEHRPPLWIPFITWRMMVGIGTFFILLTFTSWFLYFKGRLFECPWLFKIYVPSVILAVLANQAGWVAAEVGRQPWIVHPPIVKNTSGDFVLDQDQKIQYEKTTIKLQDGRSATITAGLKTSEGISKAIRGEEVIASIVLFTLIYLLLGGVWIFILNRKIQAGPDPAPKKYEPFKSQSAGLFEVPKKQDSHSRLIEDPHQSRSLKNSKKRKAKRND